MKHLKVILFFSLLLVNSSLLFSAAPPPSGTPTCWPPPCVPVDNGVIFLIIAGGLYGAKKIYDFKKKSEPVS